MRKTIGLLLTLSLLTACGNDNLEQQEKATQESLEDTTESVESKVEERTDESEESAPTNEVPYEVEQNISQFIEDMYTKNKLEDFRNLDEVVSDDFKEKITAQFSDTTSNEGGTQDTDISLQDVKIYKATSERDNEYMYVIDVEVINHDTKDILKNQHIGIIDMVGESSNLKINNVKEISNKEINE